MRKNPVATKAPAEQVVKDIRRATRKLHSSEEKIRIVSSGLRGEDSIAELCRKEGIAQSLYYSWSKEFLEAGKKRLAGDTGRRSLQGSAGVQIYMTPQDNRTAEVLSNALGRSTITAVTESQSRVKALEDSANVSRRSEERPLISANEVLRFPLEEVLVLPEGQYPVRARHIRYYEDRHFGPIDRARKGKALPTIRGFGAVGRLEVVGRLSGLTASAGPAGAEVFGEAARMFQAIAEGAKRTRKVPARV